MSLKLEGIKKAFGTNGMGTTVLKGISLEISDGELVSIVGRSGSGKSTLLYILSTLDNPSEGKIYYDNTDVTSMTAHDLHELRNKQIGFVFQFHYLLPELNVLENVLMPARKHNLHKAYEKQALALIAEVGLEGKHLRMPSEISGGEQQRVAIARALLMSPKYLFADEPTGNLDSINGDKIMSIFQKINKEKKTTILYVTHDLEFAKLAKRKIELVDGLMVTDH
jgi:ABC-type lipoprotein export system ATPase subunit